MVETLPGGIPVTIEQIRKLIPHAGSMCLLERVIECDDEKIVCETRSHLAPDNPLRHNGRVSSVCGIEYAAQAMALHGAIRRSGPAINGAEAPNPGSGSGHSQDAGGGRHGFLASVRDAHIERRYLDEVHNMLTVSAALEFDDASRVIYTFSLKADDIELLSGRAAVVLT
jgi:predicted hotdog family 3-hydroxylacyl-ACP dehydratase